MGVQFETIGYSKDFYVNGKYAGSIRFDEPDREVFGYTGRIQEVLSTDLIIKGKRKAKAGETVVTELFPLNGRILKN